MQLRHDAQLVAHPFAQFLPDEAHIFLNAFKKKVFFLFGQKTQVGSGNAQVGGHADPRDGHESTIDQVLRFALKYIAQIFLNLAAYFLLSFRFHGTCFQMR